VACGRLPISGPRNPRLRPARLAACLLANRRSAALLTAWLGLVVLGLGLMMRYDATPGAPGHPPSIWPAESRVPHCAGHAALVLVVHPHCPCSRATLAELERLLARCEGLAATVLFALPRGIALAEDGIALWSVAAAIPGVTALRDADGTEARRFGAQTSGLALLYDDRGTLVFSGGITDARGHQGDNAGSDAIRAWFDGRRTTPVSTPVYGCGLFDDCPTRTAAASAGEPR
jgi:hypothetical protein